MQTYEWHPIETAPTQQSVIVFAPWPNGQPFRGEAVKFSDGVWRWADGKPIEPRNQPALWTPLPLPPQGNGAS